MGRPLFVPTGRRRLIHYDFQAQRLYLLSRHVHHFWLGMVLMLHPRYRWIGVIWALSDSSDWRDWLPALLAPPRATT